MVHNVPIRCAKSEGDSERKEAHVKAARKVALLVIALLALAIVVSEFRKKKELTDSTVAQIESALDSLDPATRAVVVSRFAVDEARYLKQ
jgi:hypothetical protein